MPMTARTDARIDPSKRAIFSAADSRAATALDGKSVVAHTPAVACKNLRRELMISQPIVNLLRVAA